MLSCRFITQRRQWQLPGGAEREVALRTSGAALVAPAPEAIDSRVETGAGC